MGWITNIFKAKKPTLEEYELMREKEHKYLLNEDIKQFKSKFRNKLDIEYCPYKYRMYKILGHTDINSCNLQELMSLGFNSTNIWREDLKNE